MEKKHTRLEQRARELGDELQDLIEQIEMQHEIEEQALEKWAARVRDLLTLLRNHKVWLEQNGAKSTSDTP